MANNIKLLCEMCKKKESFHDIKDITVSSWTILAWDVESGIPLVTCPKCVYPVNIIKKKYGD